MTKYAPHTALLLFIRSGYEEARHKPLGPERHLVLSQRLANAFNRKAIETAEKSGLPVYIISGDQQEGSTFGERYVNALEAVFEKGYECVISIGNDCPSLTESHIREASTALEKHSLVLGPATDGGAYLIGLQKSFFQKENLQQLPWQKANLCTALRRLAQLGQSAVALLPEESDVDSFSDLKIALTKIKNSSLKREICRLIGCALSPLALFFTSFFPRIYFNDSGLRGPPEVSTGSLTPALEV